MIKTLKTLFKQDKEKFIVPKSVQAVIPLKTMWEDGIFLVGRNKYAKTFKFEDINYAVASREDKEAMFLEYSELLNALDSGATTKITINNRRLNKADFEQTILIPMAEDDLDKYRNNNFSAVIPYDLEQQRKESKEFLDDLTTRDQRMMFAVLTMVHIADTKEQLDNDTEALLAVVIILIVVLLGCAVSLFGGDGSDSTSYTPVSAEVEAYTPLIQKYGKQYGISEYVELIKAVMVQESGGRGLDPMQAAEGSFNRKYPHQPNGIKDPEYSIECGVQELKAALPNHYSFFHCPY